MPNKVYNIVELFNNEANNQSGQNGKSKDKSLSELGKQRSKITGAASDFSSTEESSESKDIQDYKNKVADEITKPQKEGDGQKQSSGYSNTGAFGVKLEKKDKIKARARRSIRIKGMHFTNLLGKETPISIGTWGVDNDASDLDILESLSNNGILIPEVTTLKNNYKTGFDKQKIGCPPIMLVVDTSGSMDYDHAMTSMCSFIETARFHNVKAGVMLFHSHVYYKHEATYDYDKLIDECFDSFECGGTSIQYAIDELNKLKDKNQLVIFVTDWEDSGISHLKKNFMGLPFKNKVTVNFGYEKVNLPNEVNIKDTTELEDTLIDLVNKNVRLGGAK